MKLLFDVMEKGVQKLKRGLRWFSNMVGLMDKGDVSALLRGSEKKKSRNSSCNSGKRGSVQETRIFAWIREGVT